MKIINWNKEKAIKLKNDRNIELEKIAVLISEKQFLCILEIPTRQNQKMFLLEYDDYAVCVPFVETENEIFIKTAFRNRKLNKQFRK